MPLYRYALPGLQPAEIERPTPIRAAQALRRLLGQDVPPHELETFWPGHGWGPIDRMATGRRRVPRQIPLPLPYGRMRGGAGERLTP
jgi:hypothetical protein